eukprot:1586328-Amphidinium_carterae.1
MWGLLNPSEVVELMATDMCDPAAGASSYNSISENFSDIAVRTYEYVRGTGPAHSSLGECIHVESTTSHQANEDGGEALPSQCHCGVCAHFGLRRHWTNHHRSSICTYVDWNSIQGLAFQLGKAVRSEACATCQDGAALDELRSCQGVGAKMREERTSQGCLRSISPPSKCHTI